MPDTQTKTLDAEVQRRIVGMFADLRLPWKIINGYIQNADKDMIIVDDSMTLKDYRTGEKVPTLSEFMSVVDCLAVALSQFVDAVGGEAIEKILTTHIELQRLKAKEPTHDVRQVPEADLHESG